MQEGSVVREQRKLGPDIWSYRWWESGPSGNRVHRRIVLGTAEQLRDISSARQITAGLVREINASDIRLAGTSMTLAQLADHFRQRELAARMGESHTLRRRPTTVILANGSCRVGEITLFRKSRRSRWSCGSNIWGERPGPAPKSGM